MKKHSMKWLGASVAVLILGISAQAQECQKDLASLSSARQAVITQLNAFMKRSKGGKLDPVAACPRLRQLAAVEGKFVAYLTTNHDWCHVPDQALNNVSQSHAKSLAMAGKACSIAAQVEKARRQQSAGPVAAQPAGPALPTGPL